MEIVVFVGKESVIFLYNERSVYCNSQSKKSKDINEYAKSRNQKL